MNRIGPRLLPCITPTVASISTFSFLTRRRYLTLVCSFFKTVIVSFGTLYLLSIFHSSSRLTESYAFTRSTNSTCVSCPYSRSCCSAFFNAKVASTHPFPNSDPHCLSIPNVQRCCVSRYAMIDDIDFAAMSPNAIPLHC